jgi:hypothetical protein
MKKVQIALFLTSFLLLIFGSCHKEDDILPANAKLRQVLVFNNLTETTPVDTVEEYEYINGQISKVILQYAYNTYEYNTSGQLIKVTNYNANLNSPTGYIILKIYTYQYSDDGKKTKETIGYPMINSSEYNLFSYTDGRLSKVENYGNSNTLVNYTVYEYDGSGQLIKEVNYAQNDMPYRWTINTFSNGLMVKTEIYADENHENKVRELKRTFDANKNLKILETYQGPYSSAVGNFVYRYVYFGE